MGALLNGQRHGDLKAHLAVAEVVLLDGDLIGGSLKIRGGVGGGSADLLSCTRMRVYC